MSLTARTYRRPARIAPGRWNLVVWIATMLAAIALLSSTVPLAVILTDVPLIAALMFGLFQAAALPLAFISPIAATVLALFAGTVLTALSQPLADAPWPVAVTTMVAFGLTWIIVGLRARWYIATTGWFLSLLATVMVVAEHGETANQNAMVADVVVFAGVTLVCLAAGILIRNWTQIRAELTAERAASSVELARRESVEDKARIARELHDVVAHGMSAIQVRAASARYRFTDLPADVATEFDELAATARTSMGEMRTILGLLRDEESSIERAPQPTMTDIDALVTRARDLGAVEVSEPWPADAVEALDFATQLVIYRVVQEALSNISRHAPGATTAVMWSASADQLTLEVRNSHSERPAATRLDGGGQGLRGMRERVAALGGTVFAEPLTDGGFVVRVLIPRATS